MNDVPDWRDFMPGSTEAMLGKLGHIEHSAVHRILQRTGLGSKTSQVLNVSTSEPPRLTFDGLMQVTDFPVILVAKDYPKRKRETMLIDLEKRPTKALLYTDLLDAEDDEYSVGLVLSSGRKLYVFHNHHLDTLGAGGRYWRIADRYYWLESLDSMLARFDDPDAW